MSETIAQERETSVQVRECRKDDKAELLNIVEKVYSQEVRRRHELLWDWWQQRGCQAGNPNHRPSVILRNGKLAGFTGIQSRRFKLGSVEEDGVFVLDSYTSPGDRGVGVSLFRHLLKTNELMLGSPIPRVKQLWKKVFGKEDVDSFHVRKGKRVIDTAAFLPSKVRPFLAWPSRLLWRCAEALLELTSRRLGAAVIQPVDWFPAPVDALCAEWASGRKNTPLRDAAYLNWRFADAPVDYEKRLLWKGSTLAGMAAFRVARMNGRKVLLVVEMLARPGDAVEAYGSLLSHILGHARLHKVADVQGFDCGCPDMRRAMISRGFLFRPEQIAIIGLHHDKSDNSPVNRPGDWFISPGDSDFEFAYFNQGWESLEAARA